MIELARHQIEAVERLSIILRQRGGAILADDIGLGKSFVAAALARDAGTTVEIIVPVSLLDQWMETANRFGIQPLITSHESLLSDRSLGLADGHLVIVDEAHAFRNSKTLRYAGLARRTIGARLLLVTATPICNSLTDLQSLVHLIASDASLRDEGVGSISHAFENRDAPAISRLLRAVVVRRERNVLPASLQFGRLDKRVVLFNPPYSPALEQLAFPVTSDRSHAALLRGIMNRRLESSAAALLESIRRQQRFYERALQSMASGRSLSRADYRRTFHEEGGGEALQQILFWEVFARDQALDVDPASIHRELQLLDRLASEMLAMTDAKYDRLLDLLCERTAPALLFTSAIATARSLFSLLSKRRACGIVTSKSQTPPDALKAFQEGRVDLLICTDLAAEGLNLQRAGMVIHYDIPWNPARLDQRNGRAHRLGQQRDCVDAIYFLPEEDLTRVQRIVAEKNRTRRAFASPGSSREDFPSCLALPERIPAGTAPAHLLRSIRQRGLAADPRLATRYRAGIEMTMEAMSSEFLDSSRLQDLRVLIAAEENLRHLT